MHVNDIGPIARSHLLIEQPAQRPSPDLPFGFKGKPSERNHLSMNVEVSITKRDRLNHSVNLDGPAIHEAIGYVQGPL